jgi:ABC-2 type transport system ATP-binding protein
MRGQSQHGTTILFSTHLMDQVTKLCTHAAILHHGRLVTSGAIDDLLARGPGQSLEDVFLHYTHDGANDRNVPGAPGIFGQFSGTEGR